MELNDEGTSDSAADSSSENKAQDLQPKRKRKQINAERLKKVKYEDITERTKTRNNKHKAPTIEELNELKETQDLYNNNLFRLQIEELIAEIKIKAKHQTRFAKWLNDFKLLVLNLREHEVSISKKSTVTLKTDQELHFKFLKPSKVSLFGLYAIEALPGPILEVSLCLKIPESCLHPKDYLNNRYFVKRHFYLVRVAKFLKEICSEISWIYHDNNDLLPVLQVKPKDSEKILIKIFAFPPNNYFKTSRFLPETNNVRAEIFGNFNEESKNFPTPFYNSTLSHDCNLEANSEFSQNAIKDHANIQEAIKLIKVWVNQRQLNLSNDLIIYFATYLVTKKKINKHMSSYQVVRNFWGFISETDFVSSPISIGDVLPEVLASFKSAFDLVFLDSTGFYNFAAFLDINSFKKIQSECKIAFNLLDDNGINSFHSLFITKASMELQYDLILRLKSSSAFEEITRNSSEVDRVKFLGHRKLQVVEKISKTLDRGFNKRALLIVPHFVPTEPWPYKQKDPNSFEEIIFGINLDPSQAFNFIELGPALNDSKEKEFKQFWGRLSSDRRFKDGSICVAVYFETKTIKGRREIIRTIVDWVAKEKLRLEYDLFYDEFEDLMVNKKVSAAFEMGTNEECCLKITTVSDDLGKKLRGLDMPLSITSVQGISNSFSFTEVFPPIPTNYRCGKKITTSFGNNIVLADKKIAMVPPYVKPIEFALQLEHSNKWAKDLVALRHMKTAFYLEISKLLSKKHNIISSARPGCLDVFHEGFVFRYLLYLPREIGLLKKESTDNGVTVYKESPQSRELEKKLNILPKLTGALKGIQSQFPSYGPGTALVKRWLRSHLIDDFHFPDVVINLLSAALYTNQTSFVPSSTPQIAFVRFLKFFAELQCHIQPVIVDFNKEISKEIITEIDSKLLQNRDACPNLYIVTPYDNCESLFTKEAPSKEVLRRVKQLAIETLSCIHDIVNKRKVLPVKNLFVPNLDGYNALIHLKPFSNPLGHERVINEDLEGQITLEAFVPGETSKIPVTDFNPVQLYLRDLRENYGEFANFFHDSYGGNIIGVLWIPKAMEVKEFKISYVNGRKLENEKLVLNVDSLIEDFFILGKDVVKSIDIN